jgi:tetratricopeptide (TPR) repeat protein
VEEDPTAIIERIGSVLEVNAAPVDVQDIFWSVRKLCEAMSRTKPVVLLLDDVQWAGSAMLDLIEYLVTFTRAPLLLLALSRRDLRDELPSWGYQSAAVELGPLTPEEIGELLSNLLDGWAMPGALQKRLVEMADGNPLYVEELIRSLIDADVLRRGAGRWELHVTPSEIQIPPTIGAIVAARLEQLSETERVVLERAAVIGKNFWWRALTALVPEEMVAGLGRVFQSLMRKELIEPDLSIKGDDDSFRFKHTLVREIAYAGISKQQRAQLHEELAGWLEKTLSTDDAGNEPLAYHLEQVVLLRRSLGFPNEAVDDLGRRAAGLLETAAERALDSADAQTAVNALRRATRLQPADDPASLGLSIKLGYALTELGEFKVARQELEMASRRATREGEPRLWAQSELLCLMLDNYLMTNDDLTIDLVRLDTLEPAFEGANDEVWLGRAEYLRANLHWDGYQLGEAEAALGRALQMARKAGCAPDVARALGSFTAVLLRGPHPVDDAIERCETIISLSSDQLLVNAKCLLRLAGLHAMKDEFTFARRKIYESRAILEDLGGTFHLAASTHEAGLVELLAGDNRAAEIEFSMGIELLESMEERATLASSAAYLARALYAQGRHEEAMHWTEASEAAWGDEGSGIVEWGPTRAKILARWGHADIAEGLARSVLEPVSDSDDVLARGHALVGLAEVLAITHRPDPNRYLEEANKLYSAKGIRPLVRRILAKLVATSAA